MSLPRSVCLCLIALCLSAAETVWIEGEAPTTPPGGDLAALVAVEGWGDTSVMSQGKVLHLKADAKQVDALVGEAGLAVAYAFTLSDGGQRQVWARIGYEWARSDLEWRLDDGAWTRLPRTQPTVNIQPIQTWNELAWIRLTTADLAAGDHVLHLRWPKVVETVKDKPVTQRILGMVDCLCIAADFRPNGKWAPGQDPQDDRDRAAVGQVFTLKAATDGSRSEAVLSGDWLYAPWEEAYPIDEAKRLQAVEALPDLAALPWRAYTVPGDRNQQMPEEVFAHRWIARCQVDVDPAAIGGGFVLDLRRFNAIVSVFVNGTYCGFSRAHSTAATFDVTKAVKAGRNEIALVFKDRYYSLSGAGEERGNRQFWNLPEDFLSKNQGTCAKHELAVAADPTTGITERATLRAVGTVYAEDVFCQPSVKKGELAVEVTVRNPGTKAVSAEVAVDLLPVEGDTVEATLPAQRVQVPAGGTAVVTLRGPVAKPRLWWPDDPQLTRARTRVSAGAARDDLADTVFGFREWDWTTDHQFRLNGLRWQLFADLGYTGTKEGLLKRMAESGMNQIRLWRNGGMYGMERGDFLSWCDAKGVVVRSSGTFDGQVANYGGGLSQGDGPKQVLFDHWREQLLAWVKAERNHPSVYIWSLENEITYINSWNLGQAKRVEPAIRDNGLAVMALDPTRPVMVDGGNCLLDESLPVNGAHYTEFLNAGWGDFPDAAYTREHWYDKERPQRGAWRMVPNRPIMKGEVYFAEGYGNDAFATIGGDRCFIGIAETYPARGLWGRMLSEGWRWAEVSSWQFWMGSIGGHDRQYWNAWQPVAVLCRQWNWSFGGDQEVPRQLKVFNQTRSDAPIDVTWEVSVGGRRIDGGKRTFPIAPGGDALWDIAFRTPKASGLRSTGTFVLTAARNGTQVFRDERSLAVLGSEAPPKVAAGAIACFDPKGSLLAHCKAAGIAVTVVEDPSQIPASAQVILVGPDALTPATCADPVWATLAAAGKRVVLFDQATPLRYGGLPADAEPSDADGCFAFVEDLSHPIFVGLDQADFFTWGGTHHVYRQAYAKPTSGGRSLVQCHDRLARSAVIECQVGKGLLVLSQLAIGEHLATEGVAKLICDRLIRHAADWKPVVRTVHIAIDEAAPERTLLGDLGLAVQAAGDPVAALVEGQIAVVAATPGNLAKLAAAKDRIQAFCSGGGWLMLWGVTPEGLSDYNRIVGHDHVLRPFETERVLLATPADPLTAGITLRDVVMDTGEKMYPWMALKRPDSDAFSFIVDHTDIAPFCRFPTPREMGKGTDEPGVDHWPRNLVNGFTSEDNWCFTYTTIMDAGHSRTLVLDLPKEEELVGLKVRTSSLYHPVTRIDVRFDDDPTPVRADLRAEPMVQEVPVAGRRAKRITLEIAGWEQRGDKNIVVLDNLWLQVKRSDDYLARVKSLLNVGALMRYDVGAGGILLNQIKVLPQERNPANAEKKRALVKALLANLGAPFASDDRLGSGVALRYDPLRFADGLCTAYAHHRGDPPWFPGKADVSGIPVGEQRFAGVAYFLSDFSTSPVPSVLMIGGPGSKVKAGSLEVPVGKRGDAVFVLHTAHAGPGVERWEKQVEEAKRRRREIPAAPVLARYVLVYADGSEHAVEVRWGQEVGPWNPPTALPLPRAALAWAGAVVEGIQPTVYSLQIANPHPDREIKTLRIAEGEKNVGTPAVFAVTVGTVVE